MPSWVELDDEPDEPRTAANVLDKPFKRPLSAPGFAGDMKFATAEEVTEMPMWDNGPRPAK